MKETLTMSRKERERMVVMDQVVQRAMTLVEGVDRMGVRCRQAKRIWGRCQARGAEVLAHRSRGLATSGWLANLHGCTGAEMSSLALRLASSLGGASTARIALAAARLGNGLKPARHTGRLENRDGPRPILRADWPTGNRDGPRPILRADRQTGRLADWQTGRPLSHLPARCSRASISAWVPFLPWPWARTAT